MAQDPQQTRLPEIVQLFLGPLLLQAPVQAPHQVWDGLPQQRRAFTCAWHRILLLRKGGVRGGSPLSNSPPHCKVVQNLVCFTALGKGGVRGGRPLSNSPPHCKVVQNFGLANKCIAQLMSYAIFGAYKYIPRR